MSETGTPGRDTTFLTADHAIARDATTVTAFVGRTLRGPVNTPVVIASFAQFQNVFGGIWQPSPLSYALEHFFEQGGYEAVVVRVINGGAAPTITLPCGTRQLTLQALTPGTREFIRAAVDYDNIGGSLGEHSDCFNLVVQRVRSPGSERIEVQETFRRVSVNPGTQRYVVNVLLESKLVRVIGDVPSDRPDETTGNGGYTDSNNDGDDGSPLTDYDIIGSATDHTGLFALQDVDRLSFVYVPPLSRDRDVGISTLLVVERFCRARQAMLIVDPPSPWRTADEAVHGFDALGFRSSHALMYFPRIVAFDKQRGRAEVFGNGGVVAGMLARSDAQNPIWSMDAPEAELVPRAGARLAISLSESDRWRLTAHGINALRASRTPTALIPLARTLAGGVHSAADWGYLRPQRLACFIVGRIEFGTRWARHVRSEPATWRRIARQVSRFLDELAVLGAFPTAGMAPQSFMVVCDERTHSTADLAAQRVNLLVAFAASRLGQYHCFEISQSPQGATVKSVAINPLQLPVVIEPWLDSNESSQELARRVEQVG